ncbi:GDP-mannose 4,6-dehydratase [Salinibacter altiplanensis]|uniref:GDP-mannose 4,6-dehydratase n=1 Tax=Salinibacter altiplanensis TaxID=1803181 RepID=UPI000C9ECF79|nr:GDP-mannose 4,6-dehydratase [Salinibacter altiplanensis]
MKYLITGGAGFIGSHLADALLEKGHHVHAFDNLSTGRLANVRHLADHDRFSLTVGNVQDYHTLEKRVVECDRIVHLAAAVGVQRIMDQPVETLQTNVGGTENVLQLAHYHDTTTLLASTSEVYGKAMDKDEDLEALSEEDDWTLGPTSKRRWAYACSKATDEFLAQAYHDEHDLPVVIARFFNTVGPRQSGRYGMVIPSFVERALAGDPIEVHGDGTQTRCFTHVADAVWATQKLLDVPEAEGEVFNIGQGTEISINELAKRIRSMTNSDSEIVHVPYEEVYGPEFEDMKRRTPDVSKLHVATGYVPQHSTDDILRDVIASAGESTDSGPVPENAPTSLAAFAS